jgi:hypothetical protein
MKRSSVVLALLLAACGRTGIDLADVEVGSAGASGAAPRANGAAAGTTGLGAGGATAGMDASAPTGPDALSTRSCVWGLEAERTYETGVAPVSIAVADFNHDGRLDLATSNWGGATGVADGSVSVLLANGPGTFAPQAMYKTEIQPNDLAAGDLTGDGLPDLVVAGGLMNLDTFRNAGDGTFVPLPGAQLSEPLAVAVGDFDGDGRADVAASMISNAIDIYVTRSDGALRAAGQYATGSMTYGLVAADLNGDGRLDLVATNVTFPPGVGLPEHLGQGRIGVYINRGGGTFADEVVYPAGNGTNALAVADLDGDGDLDVAVANDFDGSIGVFLNAGDGTFSAQVPYAIGPTSSLVNGGGMAGVVAADFDRDGHIDLATVRSDGAASVEILHNAGGGSFTHVSGPAAPAGPEAIATADFDGDGWPDLAITDARSVTIFLGHCH